MKNKTEEIDRLEELIRQEPHSPVFARLASIYIEREEYLHALALCDRGTDSYPEYATGFFLRAEALRGLDKVDESIDNYKKVLGILPRCSRAIQQIEELQRKITERGPAEQTKTETGQKVAGEKEPGKDFIGDLAEQLKGYKPQRTDSEAEREETVSESQPADIDLPIVSDTLATIFFKQKQFDRAIEAYRQLIKRNPEKADIYLTKIKEVEEAKKSEE